MKRTRILVIAIWIVSAVCALLIIESFIRGTVKAPGYEAPMARVLEEERSQVRADALKPVSIVYGAYLGEMLLFVFCSQWTSKASRRDDLTRFILALICTVLFNVMFLYLLGRPLASETNDIRIDSSATDAALQARYWSFLVAPILAFYFVKKPSS